MSTTRFLYINEDGGVGIGTVKPTQADLDCIDDGILQVIKITPPSVSHGDSRPMSVECVDAKGEGCGLPVALLATPDPDDGDAFGGAYHWVPTK